jgi:hypothetical protein
VNVRTYFLLLIVFQVVLNNSWDTSVRTGTKAMVWTIAVQFPAGRNEGIFYIRYRFQIGSGATQPTIQLVPRTISSRVKRPEEGG